MPSKISVSEAIADPDDSDCRVPARAPPCQCAPGARHACIHTPLRLQRRRAGTVRVPSRTRSNEAAAAAATVPSSVVPVTAAASDDTFDMPIQLRRRRRVGAANTPMQSQPHNRLHMLSELMEASHRLADPYDRRQPQDRSISRHKRSATL